MYKRKIKMALIGGVIAYIWYFISWVGLGAPVKQFVNSDKVASVIKENAPESGVYYLPSMHTKTAEEKTKQMDMLSHGPVVFSAIKAQGARSLSLSMLYSILTQVVGAYGIACLLLKMKDSKYLKQVLFVTGVGFLIAWLSFMPSWIWRSYSSEYTLFCMFDTVIAWFLAGLAMAKIAK